MHPSYFSRWKFSAEDAPFVAAFENWAKKAGWTRKQVEQGFSWYADTHKPNQPPMSTEDGWASWENFAVAKGFSVQDIKATAQFHDTLVTQGPAAFAEQYSRADDLKRAAEIEQLMKVPNGEYDANPEMRLEYHDILERLGGTDPNDLPLAPVQQHEPITEANQTFRMLDAVHVPRPSHTEMRLKDFDALLKNPKSDYYEGANSKALRQEYFQLLGGEAPDTSHKLQIGNVQPDTSTPAPPADNNID
jgi:hypothetical protein